MYDASAQRFHLGQRPRQIVYREVRQREGVPRATSARVQPNRRNGRPRLPAPTLSFAAALQGSAEQGAPEAQRTLGFVGGELDQGQRQPLHAHKHNARRARSVDAGGGVPKAESAGDVSALRDAGGPAAQK
jgi:hypothetical protein